MSENMKTKQQLDFSIVKTLCEQMFNLAEKFEFAELEQNISEYSRLLKQQCLAIDQSTLTNDDLHKLEQLLLRHRELVDFLKEKKETISSELKLIRLGKQMQMAYPEQLNK